MPRTLRSARGMALGLALGASGCSLRSACHEPGAAAAARPAASAAPSASVAASASAASASERRPIGPGEGWVSAVRRFDWGLAAARLDALPAPERAAPEARYVRARAAAALGDPARAAALLVGLEAELPLLATEIVDLRAQAWLHSGQHEAAATSLARKTDPESLLALARALEGGGHLDRAREAADRALHRMLAEGSSEAEQAEVRALRARLAAAQGDRVEAAAIYRWLAIHVPASPHADGADQRLAELAPAQALTRSERLERAMAFARAGAMEAADRELARVAGAPGPPVTEAEQLFARALGRYNARQEVAVAVDLFARAAELDPQLRTRNLFFAARAVSRLQDDRRAMTLFRELARRFPQASEAGSARFQVARLSYVLGDYPAAIAAYGDYLGRHGPHAEFADSARYERAVCYLASGAAVRAAAAFAELIADQKDDLLRASYRELRGVALLASGHRAEAESEFRAVIATDPLSLPALLAMARLRALGVVPPLAIAPAAEEAPLPGLAVTLPAKPLLLQRLGLDADAELALKQAAPVLQRAFVDRGDEALCRAYAELSVGAERFAVARRYAQSGALRRAPSPRSQWLWDCLYPRPYAALVADAETTERLPAHLVHAVMRQESGFRPQVVSPAAAVGLLQLIPSTARALSQELSLPFDPADLGRPPHNIRLGARYLRHLLDRFGDHPVLAAAGYNAGPQAVSHWLESGESLPLDLFVARIPYYETRVYVLRVLGNLARYAFLAGGEAAVPALDLDLPRGKRALPEDY